MLHTVALFKFEMQDVFGLNARRYIPKCTFSTFVTVCFISLKLGTLQNVSLTVFNCRIRIETIFKSHAQICAWFQMSSRLL